MFQNVRKSKFWAMTKEWVEALVIAVIIAMVIRTFVVQAFKIPTGSMEPTLHGDKRKGDRILVNKFLYWYKEPKRGDIIVFKTKGILGLDQEKDYIKRLIGLPGETVEIKDGDIYINDVHIKDARIDNIEYLNTDKNYAPYGVLETKVTVPEGMYFVLGDNSPNSKDSRFWGFVPKENIKGKAILIYWPFSRCGLLK